MPVTLHTLARPVRPLVADAPSVVGEWTRDGATYRVEGRVSDDGLSLTLVPIALGGMRVRRFDTVLDGRIELRRTDVDGCLVGDWSRVGRDALEVVAIGRKGKPLDGEEDGSAWTFLEVSLIAPPIPGLERSLDPAPAETPSRNPFPSRSRLREGPARG